MLFLFHKYFAVDMKYGVGVKVPAELDLNAELSVPPIISKSKVPAIHHLTFDIFVQQPTMPTKLRTAVRRSLLPLAGKNSGSGVGISAEGTVFYCPSCSTWRRRMVSTAATNTYRTRNGAIRHAFHNNNNINTTTSTVRRYLSSSAARTNCASPAGVADVNRNVPARFRELYAALKELEDVAADHISLSRLQLAQRGLESEEHVVRVAGISPSSFAIFGARCLIYWVVDSTRCQRCAIYTSTCQVTFSRSVDRRTVLGGIDRFLWN